MAKSIDILLPDIGEFDSVDVIEVLVAAGDTVEKEASLLTLESDKATMEIPSPHAGVIKELCVAVGDKISQGARLGVIEVDETAAPADKSAPTKTSSASAAPAPQPEMASVLPDADITAEVVVMGAGPGGYTAAFRAADLGKQVILIERFSNLGGVCLNVGCIPSKALLHAADVITEASEMEEFGVSFGKPKIDIDKLRGWKEQIIGKLTGGLGTLAKKRKVEVITGNATFEGPHLLSVATEDGTKTIAFQNCIIAAGSEAVELPGFPNDDPRLITSTGALALADVPKRMLVVGGGIIGLEMATVYDALGSKVTVVELGDQLMPGCDKDLVRPLERRIKKSYENIYLGTQVTGIKALNGGLKVSFEGKKAPETDTFDRVLVAVGRRPNGKNITADKAGVHVDERGFIPADPQQRTNVPHIYAIGDIVGQPMLAHKATHEAKVAAEVIADLPAAFDPLTIPSVAYTNPEIAWAGVTEAQAKEQGLEFEKASFPWAASGRSLSMGRDDGVTKLIVDKASHKVIGVGITGPNAGELIAEAVLAIEMGADVEDLALTIHPHPTLSETLNFAAEMIEGTCTDLYIPKRGKK
ncbi:MAG TPA: dihydrolipoyl dehydrogenase [Chromatiaceae bacterium]|jgi:dihydrolipoamide dehydrogenase|nr:dihydrolipoyl dehydrogenase [Chromatiaceae bacterium]HIA08504.1 dihydrolipoyl dehydrogenase [Chromatiaceae bacterium]HIB83810.1 dihydrolipoyl dehydrogenase [Chromatiaceae bacterium]HIN82405.1 dihydrolipoyl dehydrogenase [Chromatiales bacterium]HIO13778.1 dihydrolipoyl dehydrogenase [Chromatiales bacterium]